MASEKNFKFLTDFEFFSCIFNVCHFSVDTRPRVVRNGLLSVDNSVSITTKRHCLSCACLGLAVRFSGAFTWLLFMRYGKKEVKKSSWWKSAGTYSSSSYEPIVNETHTFKVACNRDLWRSRTYRKTVYKNCLLNFTCKQVTRGLSGTRV